MEEHKTCFSHRYLAERHVRDEFSSRTKLKLKSTNGWHIAANFSCLLENYAIQDKIIAYITDSGSNLSTCTSELASFVNCIYYHMDNHYHGSYCEYIMSNLYRKTLKSNHYNDISLLNIGQIRGNHDERQCGPSNLERGIEDGLDLLESQMPSVKLYSTAKICRDPFLMMTNQMYDYKEEVYFCYSSPTSVANNPEICQRQNVKFFDSFCGTKPNSEGLCA